MTTTLTYATALKLNQYLGQVGNSPTWTPDAKPTGKYYESVGTGNGTATVFYTNYQNLIEDTYAFYSGTAMSVASALTVSTDYTINLDKGELTLTSTGLTIVGTANLYGIYQYNTAGITNTSITASLVRAQDYIERNTETIFVDGSVATPSYGQATQELHTGGGQYNRWYFADKYPAQFITTQLSGDVTSTATASIAVDSTNGFASAGTICIDTEQITYTGKTTTTFTGCTRGANGSTTSSHSADIYVTRHIVEYSLTEAGSEPSWQTLQYLTDYSFEPESGRVKLLNFDLLRTAILNNKFPVEDLPDRVRLTYPYGWNVIPDEITLLTLMLASKELMGQTVNKALIEGRNEFKPSLLAVNDEQIKSILERYTSQKIGRT